MECGAHLIVLAVDALAVLGAEDGGLKALAIFLEAEGLLAVAALVVPRHSSVCVVLLTETHECLSKITPSCGIGVA